MSIAHKSFEYRAASATLAALRAVLPNPQDAHSRFYCLLPLRAPQDRESVIDYLIAQPKPLWCTALELCGFLAIVSWRPSEWRAVLPDEPWRDLETIRRAQLAEAAEGHEAAVLLFDVPGEVPVTLRAKEIVQWREQYEIINLDVAWTWEDAERDARTLDHGATALVKLVRSSSGGGSTGRRSR